MTTSHCVTDEQSSCRLYSNVRICQMLANILKMPVSKACITRLTNGLGALNTTYLEILWWTVTMVYVLRDWGGPLISVERLLG